jgi:CO/xanthine dehydrogenase Mo-binding subunit
MRPGEPTLTRRDFVKIGGALFVSFSLPGTLPGFPEEVQAAGTTLDPTLPASWLEIHEDGSIIARTGKTETGTSASAFYTQMIAEELDVDPSSITLVMGHTDETPDGGYSAGFLMGGTNQKKVAAYTRQALVGLASTRLGVPVANLTVTKGIVSGAGKSVSYGELVKGQQLDLKIPVSGSLAKIDSKAATGIGGLVGIIVTGNPPTKPIPQYSVVGTSLERKGIRDIVTGKPIYSGDVVVPGMLHARMVRPSTLGSQLVSVGGVDKSRFPTAQVVKKGNLVAVVAANEWEAVQAAQAVSADTTWTPWSGLPANGTLSETLRKQQWTPVGKRGDQAKADAGLAGATKVLSASYEQPYVRHAPIGAFVAVADAKPDGSITIWSQTSQSQGARAQIAHIMGVPAEKVVIRWAQGPGQYGRTTNGGDGAMADAAIVSQLVGKPVRVQWTIQEDLAWSSVSQAWVADVKAGLDAQGNLVAYRSEWYAPHENDARMLGGILSGSPTPMPLVAASYNGIQTVWPYDKVPGVLEQAYFTGNIGAESAGGGLRGNIMRTPAQRQQNYALESIITEASAAAGADPIDFRIRHTSNEAFIGIMKATAEAAGWKPRPSPSPDARKTGSTPLKGRGVGTILRSNAPWVAIADIEVVPSTGVVRVTQLTIGVDVGKVMNPRHLTSMLQGGAVMGLGEALFEEVTFDSSRVTSTDWTKYRIPRMQDVPEIKTVFTSRNDRGINSGGEAANSAAPIAIVAAFFDATGVMPRRIPLTPAYVKSLLNA